MTIEHTFHLLGMPAREFHGERQVGPTLEVDEGWIGLSNFQRREGHISPTKNQRLKSFLGVNLTMSIILMGVKLGLWWGTSCMGRGRGGGDGNKGGPLSPGNQVNVGTGEPRRALCFKSSVYVFLNPFQGTNWTVRTLTSVDETVWISERRGQVACNLRLVYHFFL